MKRIIVVCCILCSFNIFSQEKMYKEKGLSITAQSLILKPYFSDGYTDLMTDYELENNSVIYGGSMNIRYMVSPYIGFGLNIGVDKLNQPEFVYYPISSQFVLFLKETIKTGYFRLDFGSHLGDLDKGGFLFRGGFGYRTSLFKNVLIHTELLYSYQNMYKSFDNSGRSENYYNIESLGFSISFEFYKNK